MENKMYYYIFYFVAFVAAARTTGLPIKYCHTSDLDLIIVAGYADDQIELQSTRINNIVDYFVRSRKTTESRLRTAVIGYFDSYCEKQGVKTILNFTEVNSTYTLSEQIKESFYLHFNVQNLVKKPNIVDNVQEFVSESESIGVNYLTIYLCQENTELTFLSCFYQNGVNIFPQLQHFILLIYKDGSRDVIQNSYLHSIEMIQWKDNMSDVNTLGLKLCGNCPVKWLQFESKTKPSFISCYLPYVTERLISWKEAEKECRGLQSSLVNVQVREELEYLQENICVGIPDLEECHDKTFPIGLSLISKTLYRRYEWTNKNPLVLMSNIFTNELPIFLGKDCYVITVVQPLNDSQGEIGIKSKLVGCDAKIINANLCEINVIFKLSEEYYYQHSLEGQTHLRGIVDVKKFLFDCGNQREYVHYLQVCNDYNGCRNGRDEEFCSNPSTMINRNTKRCTSKVDRMGSNLLTYVPKQVDCNGIVDCDGGRDESGCDQCPEITCFEGGTCLPYSLAQNINNRCLTCHIVNSTSVESAQVKYVCYTSLKPRPDHQVALCDKSQEKIFQEYFRNSNKKRLSKLKWAPRCVYLRGMSGPPLGCPDMSHLQDCENYTCPEDMAKCPFSYCIPLKYITDGISDCLYGEDEVMDVFIGNKGLRKCVQNLGDLRTLQVNVCDDYVDCGSYADEMNCHHVCPNGFACHGGVVSVDGYDANVPLESLQVFDKKVKVLNLSGVNLSSIRSLGEGVKYSFFAIDFSNCSLATDAGSFYFPNKFSVQFFKLYEANFSYNSLSIISQAGIFSQFTNLRFLYLQHNVLLELIEEKSFTSIMLRIVDISFTRISKLPKEMLQSNQLESINLHSTNILSISWFPRNTILSVLDLRNNSLEMHSVKTEYFNNLSVGKALYTDYFKLCCPQVTGPGIPQYVCHSPLEAISSCDDLIGDLVKRALLWCVAVTSAVGNAAVLIYRVAFDKDVLKRSFGVFVFNLGISDFIMGLYIVLIASVDIYYRQEYVLHEYEWRHSYLCKTAGFLSSLSNEVSTFFVLLITVDRFLKFKFPFGQYKFTTMTLSISVISAWCFGLVLALIPLVNTKWTIYSSNGMCLGVPLMAYRESGWTYAVGVFIVLNFVLFSVIAIGQLTIYRSIESGRSITASATNVSKRREQEIDIAKQLFLVAMSNFICWLPICVLGVRSLTGQAVSNETYSWLVVFVLPLNSAVNPMIYTIPFAYQKWLDFKKGRK